MRSDSRILVAGAGGFIGGHLVRRLRRLGYTNIRAVDVKPVGAWHQHDPDVENISADLRLPDACQEVMADVDFVFNLAADMGGMGFIESHKADCMLLGRCARPAPSWPDRADHGTTPLGQPAHSSERR